MGTQGKGLAVVTGASSGIGKIYADRLAKRGFDLLLVARRKQRLEQLSQELQQKHGVKAEILVADLGNSADLERVSKALASDERITLLVNNAGVGELKPTTAISLDAVNSLIDVNNKAITHLTLAVLPNFTKRNSGTIINIGSILSFFALPMSTVYSATKAFLAIFTIGLRDELKDTDVKVQLVLPAATETEIWELSGIPVAALDPKTVMTAEHCVDAALAGLDKGETITYPSVENFGVFEEFDAARGKLFVAGQNGKPASRYNLTK
ncbi:MAG: short chain dehydrogenase family protein [Acidobacteriaceae bacterium]|nr:short chain dehydrogenase family protein [Acidobacteriaceae bacterium]